MYHSRFKGRTHYNAGYKWGDLLYKNNNIISNKHTFVITEGRKKFANKCLPIYEKYYPEILEEIKGIADGQMDSYENLYTFLLSMYCFEFDNHCTCLAFKDDNNIIFGRNSEHIEVIKPNKDGNFVAIANEFNSQKMSKYNNYDIDDWRAEERYLVAYNSLKENNNSFSIELVKDILSGQYGFMCQYDRKTNADTVWSVIYDVKNRKIYRVEGNPSRKRFKEDKRLNFK